jgi:nuclear pore complex protein Nup93
MIKNKLSGEWERRKKTLIEQGHFEGGSTINTSAPIGSTFKAFDKNLVTSTYSGPKFTAYLNTVKKLNEARLKGTKIAIAKAFANELKGLDRELRSEQISSCWDCLSIIEREDEQYSDVNLSGSYRAVSGSISRTHWNRALISGSKKYLENSYSKYIDSTISHFPRDALLGGKPSNIDRIKTFIHIRMKRGSPNEIQMMDLIEGTPIWACIFYLIRCGYLREAYNFAIQYEFNLLKTEPNFVAYLKAFIETEDNYLTGTLKAQIQSDYSQRLIVGNQDPYKMTLFKILGRCDLSKKTVPDVITTTQDYIWLQLWLIKDGQESSTSASSSPPQYNLTGLQKLVLDFGPKHFNPKGNNPVQYFETLLTVGLFEDAVAYLYESSHQLDAIHFAIAMFYHGTANAVPNPVSPEWETVVSLKEPASQQMTRCLNYFKLISTIAKAFSAADVLDAVQYYLTLPLASHGYNEICQVSIRDAVLVSGSISSILGDITADGSQRPGIIAKFSPLMTSNGFGNSLEDQRRFINSLTKSAAAKCEKDDKFLDAVHLYNLAGEYEKVLEIICRKMSQTFSQAYVSSEHGTVYNSAKSVYQFYISNQEPSTKIQSRPLETCKTLLGLLEFKKMTAESQWHPALQLIEDLGLLFSSYSGTFEDSSTDLTGISAAVENFKTLDDTITCNLSEILLLAMTSIYQTFQETRQFASHDIGRQQEISKLRRKSRNLMILVGMLQYRVSQEVCAKMTRMDIFMN